MTTQAWKWVDPDGGVYDLDVDWDVAGYLAPSVIDDVDVYPGQAGGVRRSAQHVVSETELRHTVRGTSESDFWSNLEEILEAMDPTRGVGALRVVTDTRTRERQAWVVDGLQGVDVLDDTAGLTHLDLELVFRHGDPLWRPQNPVAVTLTTPDTGSFFPFNFPYRIGTDTGFGNFSLDNVGRDAVWPRFTLNGAFTSVTVTNVTTGFAWTITRTTTANESIVVDTRPNAKTVTLQDGTDLFTLLTGRLWPAERGVNNVTIDVTATDASTEVLVEYWPGYYTP